MKTFWQVGFYVVFVMLAFPSIANAYINPGSGIILVQVLLAIAAGGVFMFKSKIVDVFAKIFKRDKVKRDNNGK